MEGLIMKLNKMKNILLAIGIMFCISGYSQIDTISNGENGASVRDKLNTLIRNVNSGEFDVLNVGTLTVNDTAVFAAKVNTGTITVNDTIRLNNIELTNDGTNLFIDNKEVAINLTDSLNKIKNTKKLQLSKFNSREDSIQKILFLGDSRFTWMAGRFRDMLVSSNYCNGIGFVKWSGNSISNSNIFTITETNVIFNDSPTNNEEWGLSSSSVLLTDSSSISYTNTDQSGEDVSVFTFSQFDLVYLKSPSDSGDFQYRIDGGAWNKIDCYSATSQLGLERVSIPIASTNTNHLIEIEGVSDTCRLYGIRTYKSEPIQGIISDFIHVGGSAASEWKDNMKYVSEYVKAIGFDQVHIFLGANDYGLGSTPSDFINNIDTIIMALDSNSIDWYTPVIYTNYQEGDDLDSSILNVDRWNVLSKYNDSIISYGAKNNYPVFRVDQLFPDRPLGAKMGFWNDPIHFTYDAGEYLSNNLTDIIAVSDIQKKNVMNPIFDADVQVNRSNGILFYKLNSLGDIIPLHRIYGSTNADNRVIINLDDDSDFEYQFLNTHIQYDNVGEVFVPSSINDLSASTGVISTMLRDKNILIQGSISEGSVNITANPQISNGIITGQEIVLIGNSDVRTVTFDDGDGLILNGGSSFVMGNGDILVLIYIAGKGWLEKSRSDN